MRTRLTKKIRLRAFSLPYLAAILIFCGCTSASSLSDEASSPGLLVGKVLDGNQNPVAAATVTFISDADPTGAEDSSDETDANGYYALQASSGSGTLTVTSNSGSVLYEEVAVTLVSDEVTLLDFPEGRKGEFVLSQIDADLDGTLIEDSSWGSLEVTIPGSTDVRFVNLIVNGAWVIQNTPIAKRPDAEEGEDITIHITFNLDVTTGMDVSSVEVAVDVTPDVLGSAPVGTGAIGVGTRDFIIYNGFSDTGVVSASRKAFAKRLRTRLQFAENEQSQSASHPKDFPNQEAPTHGSCVPTAVSNSLKFLNKKWSLGLSDEATSIDKAREMVRSTPGGPTRNWWENKDNYMQNNQIPITTRQLTSWEEVLTYIAAGQDVEMDVNWYNEKEKRYLGHAMAIVGITLGPDGKVTVEVAHDGEQKKDGGLLRESLEYDRATNKFISGSAKGTELGAVVAEIVNQN